MRPAAVTVTRSIWLTVSSAKTDPAPKPSTTPVKAQRTFMPEPPRFRSGVQRPDPRRKSANRNDIDSYFMKKAGLHFIHFRPPPGAHARADRGGHSPPTTRRPAGSPHGARY